MRSRWSRRRVQREGAKLDVYEDWMSRVEEVRKFSVFFFYTRRIKGADVRMTLKYGSNGFHSMLGFQSNEEKFISFVCKSIPSRRKHKHRSSSRYICRLTNGAAGNGLKHLPPAEINT